MLLRKRSWDPWLKPVFPSGQKTPPVDGAAGCRALVQQLGVKLAVVLFLLVFVLDGTGRAEFRC